MKIKLILIIMLLALGAALICAPTLLLPHSEIAEIYMASGDGYKIRSNPDEFYRLYTSGEFMGIRLEIAGNTLSAAEVMERLKVVRSRRSDAAGRECYYAYSPLTGAAVDLGGELVNVQIVKGENCLIVGIPLIMGSY